MSRQFKRHNRHKFAGHPANGFSVELEIVRGRARNLVRSVDVPAYLMGAAEDCDLVLGDPLFPEAHTYIMKTERNVTIRHLGFEPALEVNGHRVGKVELADGDHIRMGPYEFVVRISLAKPGGGSAAEMVSASGTLELDDRSEDDLKAYREIDLLIADIRDALGIEWPRISLRLFRAPKETGEPNFLGRLPIQPDLRRRASNQ